MALVSFIIPYYNGDEYRLRNLLNVLDFYLEHSSEDAEIILCEQISTIKYDVLKKYKQNPKFKYFNQKVSWKKFNKSSCWNHAVKKSTGKYIVGVDADIISDPSLIKNDSILNYMSQYKLVYPFDSIVDLTYDEAISFTEDSNFINLIDINASKDRVRKGTRCYGGIWYMSKEDYITMGGYNESFRSWGGEDDMFAWIFVAMFGMENYYRIPTHCFHIWHPISNTMNYLMSSEYQEITNLKQHIMNSYYDKNTAPKYCNTQKAINGLVGK